MFDDEDIWAEFKTELDARHLKTGLGIQGMLSKFVAEKRQTQLQEELEENGNNGADEVRDASNNNKLHRRLTSILSMTSYVSTEDAQHQQDASNNNNLLRRISRSLSMAPSITSEATHQQHQAEQLLQPLSGRRSSVSHTNIPETSSNNYHSRESEKSGKIEEMQLSSRY